MDSSHLCSFYGQLRTLRAFYWYLKLNQLSILYQNLFSFFLIKNLNSIIFCVFVRKVESHGIRNGNIFSIHFGWCSVYGLRLWWVSNRAIWAIQWPIVCIWMVSFSDRNAKNVFDFCGKHTTTGDIKNLYFHRMHTRNIQKGN